MDEILNEIRSRLHHRWGMEREFARYDRAVFITWAVFFGFALVSTQSNPAMICILIALAFLIVLLLRVAEQIVRIIPFCKDNPALSKKRNACLKALRKTLFLAEFSFKRAKKADILHLAIERERELVACVFAKYKERYANDLAIIDDTVIYFLEKMQQGKQELTEKENQRSNHAIELLMFWSSVFSELKGGSVLIFPEILGNLREREAQLQAALDIIRGKPDESEESEGVV
ncbi:hypothetical protein JNK13_00805 [bacterium]|nr:hypothetical protein [bacterium]